METLSAVGQLFAERRVRFPQPHASPFASVPLSCGRLRCGLLSEEMSCQNEYEKGCQDEPSS
jgi:hypothetical protein